MDYNDFLVQSMQAGAQMDNQGNIQHTPASIATFTANQEHWNLFNNQEPPRIPVYGNPSSFWDIFKF